MATKTNHSDLQKKGDVEDASNYRPICTSPALYKLFSTLLYARFFPNLPSWLQTNKPNSGSLDGVQAVGTTLPILGDPESATFWVNASRVLPPLTTGNVKNPSIPVLFSKKREKRNKIQKKQEKREKTARKNKNR